MARGMSKTIFAPRISLPFSGYRHTSVDIHPPGDATRHPATLRGANLGDFQLVALHQGDLSPCRRWKQLTDSLIAAWDEATKSRNAWRQRDDATPVVECTTVRGVDVINRSIHRLGACAGDRPLSSTRSSRSRHDICSSTSVQLLDKTPKHAQTERARARQKRESMDMTVTG